MLSRPDYLLSMRISARARNDTSDLRTILLHRLRPDAKAVLRLSNSRDLTEARMEHYSVYCENCSRWERHPDWGDDWECPQCGTKYQMELAVYSAIDE
jgi:hypothetical protein